MMQYIYRRREGVNGALVYSKIGIISGKEEKRGDKGLGSVILMKVQSRQDRMHESSQGDVEALG